MCEHNTAVIWYRRRVAIAKSCYKFNDRCLWLKWLSEDFNFAQSDHFKLDYSHCDMWVICLTLDCEMSHAKLIWFHCTSIEIAKSCIFPHTIAILLIATEPVLFMLCSLLGDLVCCQGTFFRCLLALHGCYMCCAWYTPTKHLLLIWIVFHVAIT